MSGTDRDPPAGTDRDPPAGTDRDPRAGADRDARAGTDRDPRAGAVRLAWLCASVSLVALIFLCLAWELWLAPIRPGGSLLVLKTLPLLAPLFGVLRGNRYTLQWSSMFILAYFSEGVMRGWSEAGLARELALGEAALSLVFFVSAVAYARLARPAAASVPGQK